MNHHHAHDRMIESNMERFSPHLGIMDNNVPFKVATKLAHQSPVISTVYSWLSENVDGDDLVPYADEVETV